MITDALTEKILGLTTLYARLGAQTPVQETAEASEEQEAVITLE